MHVPGENRASRLTSPPFPDYGQVREDGWLRVPLHFWFCREQNCMSSQASGQMAPTGLSSLRTQAPRRPAGGVRGTTLALLPQTRSLPSPQPREREAIKTPRDGSQPRRVVTPSCGPPRRPRPSPASTASLPHRTAGSRSHGCRRSDRWSRQRSCASWRRGRRPCCPRRASNS